MPKEKVLNTIISAVMPVYNVERFVSEAIESVLNQSFDKFELIIINDGSTDSTSKILNSFSDNRIRLIERENRGSSASINEGVSLSNGKYIAIIHGDDINLPDRFKLQYEYMESNPDVDILGGQVLRIDEDGHVYGEPKKPLSSEYISQYINYTSPVVHPTFFMRKHVFEALNGYKGIRTAEDYDFLLRAFEYRFKIENIPNIILKYRSNPHGLALSNALRQMVHTRYVLKMHKDRIKGKNNDEKIIAFLRTYKKTPSRWFRFFNNIQNNFLLRSKNKNVFARYACLIIVIFASMMHYEIFLFSLRGFRSLRWNRSSIDRKVLTDDI